MVYCLVWRIDSVSGGQKWPRHWSERTDACKYHEREGLAPRTRWENAGSKSHASLFIYFLIILPLLGQWYYSPHLTHTIVYLLWYGYTMGTIYLLEFPTVCLLHLWCLSSTEKNGVASHGNLKEAGRSSVCLTHSL